MRLYSLKKRCVVLAALLTLAGAAQAQVDVQQAWIRATVPQQKTTGAFMQLTSASDARLVGASTPLAGSAEIHAMEMKGNMMRMHAVDGVDLPAGKSVNFASGGYHIMLLDLKRQLKAGDSVPLTLLLQDKDKKRSALTLNVPVKPLNYLAPPAH